MKYLIIFTVFFSLNSNAQIRQLNTPEDSSKRESQNPVYHPAFEKISIKPLILPIAFIAYGFCALESDGLKDFDEQIKEEVWTDKPHRQIRIDNYLQYTPAAAVYALNAIGIEGKNNFKDRTIIYLLSNAMMGITVQSLKAITRVQRPDGFGTNAFPSGHTATAFAAAEFLWQEYKGVSPLYGIVGYASAAATAYLRMYNNKHWFRDLLPGAGIGILSTKAAYLLYPVIQKHIYKNHTPNMAMLPFYQNGAMGLTMIYNFHHKE
jgi:hypothetical protein